MKPMDPAMYKKALKIPPIALQYSQLAGHQKTDSCIAQSLISGVVGEGEGGLSDLEGPLPSDK